MLRGIDELHQHRENASRKRIERIIDEYYDSLGLENLDADWLVQGLEDAGIRGDEEMTFIIPRQLPTDTVEQVGLSVIGRNVGESLLEAGEIDSYSVVGAPLSDKMYGRNAEKRGYAIPAAISPEGVEGIKLADIQDGYSIGSHSTRVGDEEAVEELLGMDPEIDNLRDMHASREKEMVNDQGDFTVMQRRMISELMDEGQRPEMLGMEYDDGKMIAVRYNPETDTYESLDSDRPASLDTAEASDRGILLPGDNYEKLVFPMAVHTDVGYMLKGLDNDKFRTEATDTLEETFEGEGLDFPFLDASPEEVYSDHVPDSARKELKQTQYGSSSSLEEDALVLNAYPAASIREGIDPQELRDDSFEGMMDNVVREVYRQ